MKKHAVLLAVVLLNGLCALPAAGQGRAGQPVDDPLSSFAMPAHTPSYPPGPYRFVDREFLIITYETDPEALRAVVPAPLEIPAPLVKFEFIRMPDSSGFGNFTEAGQVVPVTFEGQPGQFVLAMFLDDQVPVLAGREIWGFPKKLASPSLEVDPVSRDTLVGRLKYGTVEVAVGTMGYKYRSVDAAKVKKAVEEVPNYLLKIVPGADGSPALRQLVRYYLKDVTIKGAWTGPADLQLFRHALAPVASLPVKRIVSCLHFVSDLTLPYGEVVLDYLKKPAPGAGAPPAAAKP